MEDTSHGTVYLIGAGPGNPDLITVRGRQLLEQCDVVVYDNLIPDELIVRLPERVERRYVGKLASVHSLPQDEINNLLVTLAKGGKRVARLKGGDPFTFGRGAEEATVLRQHKIPYEIVPGVTAASAAMAYAGIPPTDRRKASLVMYVTGHKGTQCESMVDWNWVAKAQFSTLVIYMGVGELEHLAADLVAHGMAVDTPAAVIERGTFPTQRVLTGRLDTIATVAKENNVRPPSLIVIGHVIDLKDEIEWFAGRPLFGHRIMITRPADQADVVYNTLRDLGAEVLSYPTIATRAHIDKSGWQAMAGLGGDNRWLILTSENGVRYFIDQYVQRFGDIRTLSAYKIAAIGFGTARAMDEYHLKPDFVPEKATVNNLSREMVEKLDLDNAQVVRVRGNLADSTAEDALSAAGAKVVPVTVYETYTPTWPDNLKEKLFRFPPEFIVFTSGSSADGLVSNLNAEEIARLRDAKVVSIGPSTTKVIESHGMKVSIEATTHSIPGVVEKLVEYVNSQR
ncbi:uroporphyrinogen-III C-methyltransferase [candidate division GN15 bacterium]|nr:uroporphyrinogen-III C-methyltransferase [candidate division GN15 bacterium]